MKYAHENEVEWMKQFFSCSNKLQTAVAGANVCCFFVVSWKRALALFPQVYTEWSDIFIFVYICNFPTIFHSFPLHSVSCLSMHEQWWWWWCRWRALKAERDELYFLWAFFVWDDPTVACNTLNHSRLRDGLCADEWQCCVSWKENDSRRPCLEYISSSIQIF